VSPIQAAINDAPFWDDGEPNQASAEAGRRFRIKRAFAATAVAQLFSLLSMLMGLLSVPLYLHFLGQERYGVLLTGIAYSGFLMIADGGLSWSSMLLISQANARGDQREIASIVRASIVLAFGSSAAVLFVVVFLLWLTQLNYVSAFLPVHAEFPGLVLSLGVYGSFTLGSSTIYNVFFGLQEAHWSAFYQGLGRTLGNIASLLAAACGASLGIVFTANTVCFVLIGALAAYHCIRKNPKAFSNGAWWQPEQFHVQLRTGLKNFSIQVGNIIIASAPVISISRFAGNVAVPGFNIPMTLLNTPTGIVQSLNANMQAAYGDAVGSNDHAWIASTVERLLRQSILFLGLLSAGYFATARPFIELWTVGRLAISDSMLLSVTAIAVCFSLDSIFRFALIGMNRHRLTGISEIGFGIMAIVGCSLIVYILGPDYVGLGILVSYLSTSAWLLPLQLYRELGDCRLFPTLGFCFRTIVFTIISSILGRFVVDAIGVYSPTVAILAGATLVVLCFGTLCRSLLADDFRRAVQSINRIFRSIAIRAASIKK
jgi:O-antigen/teichoic acid export membrane protein